MDAGAAAAAALPLLVVTWSYAQRGKQRGSGDLVSIHMRQCSVVATPYGDLTLTLTLTLTPMAT